MSSRLPVAVGAAIACPERPVIALEARSGIRTPEDMWPSTVRAVSLTFRPMAAAAGERIALATIEAPFPANSAQ